MNIKIASEEDVQRDIAVILDTCDDRLEGANYHDMIGLASKIFANTKNLVSTLHHKRFAQEISNSITSHL